MTQSNLNVLVGGAAGLGVKTAGLMLARIFTRAGLRAFGNVEYPSIIRGDHNSFQVTVGDRELGSNESRIDVLLALDRLSIDLHLSQIPPSGAILGEEGDLPAAGGRLAVGLPLKALGAEAGGGPSAINTVGIAATTGLLGYGFEHLSSVLRDALKKLKPEAMERTLAACAKAHAIGAARSGDLAFRPPGPVDGPKRMLLTGNDALCLGAIRAGMKVYAGYPMTPTTSILATMAKLERELGMAVKQTEDEISAAGVAVGAAYAGVRSMVGTSGGGFCLMVEQVGLAGMTETPVVFVESQRPGPSTGLPTRTEQGDLLFVLSASQGEFPRIVIAPGDPPECFKWGFEAFNLAEKFQTPVILLLDKHVSESYWTCEKFESSGWKVDRGEWADPEKVRSSGVAYLRHALTPSGVSPRLLPGTPGLVTVTTGDEHDEEGHITEEPVIRSRQMEKRLRKLDRFDVSAGGCTLHGDPKAANTVVGWGSTKSVILEAVERLGREGASVNFLQVRFMCPFPGEQVRRVIEGSKNPVLVENNATGQLGQLIAQKTGMQLARRVLKYDGRMFMADDLTAELRAAFA